MSSLSHLIKFTAYAFSILLLSTRALLALSFEQPDTHQTQRELDARTTNNDNRSTRCIAADSQGAPLQTISSTTTNVRQENTKVAQRLNKCRVRTRTDRNSYRRNPDGSYTRKRP